MSDTWTGDYADDGVAAVTNVLDAVKVDRANFIELHYGNETMSLVPVDPNGRWEFHIDIRYSGPRDQYQARIRRYPHVREEAGT